LQVLLITRFVWLQDLQKQIYYADEANASYIEQLGRKWCWLTRSELSMLLSRINSISIT